jgi:ABC-type polysaccharide/polyol phosphate export permease
MITNLWQHRSLIEASTLRQVLGRYQGLVLGLLW